MTPKEKENLKRMTEELYSMTCFEYKIIKQDDRTYGDAHIVLRVPGGWIYFNHDETSQVFIPFNNEFQNQK